MGMGSGCKGKGGRGRGGKRGRGKYGKGKGKEKGQGKGRGDGGKGRGDGGKGRGDGGKGRGDGGKGRGDGGKGRGDGGKGRGDGGKGKGSGSKGSGNSKGGSYSKGSSTTTNKKVNQVNQQAYRNYYNEIRTRQIMTNIAATNYQNKLIYNYNYSNYLNNLNTLYQSSSSSLRYLVILGSAGLATLAISSIVISLSLIPLYLSSSSSSTTSVSSLAIPGTVLSRDTSPVTRISSLSNQLVSSSQSGVTIWNTSDRRVTRILTSDPVDQVRYLNTNTVVTISRTGNLSYWNTNGELRRSVSISNHGSHTSMLVRNSNEVIIGTKTGKIVYYSSEGAVNKVEETTVEIVNMTLLQNNNLVTVDIDKKIKLYRSSDYTIIKTIDRSSESSQIRYITSGFVDNTEYIKYTVNSKFVVLNYITEAVFKSIETHQTIQAIEYVNNKIVSVAVSQMLYFYELSSGYMVERVSINRDILTLDSNTTHVFVGTKTGEISILQWVNKFVTTFITKESTSETVIGTNTGRIAILNSKNIITKTIETNVQIALMTFLSNFNLVSVDTAKKIKIWKSNTYDLVKTIDRSADTGDITLISTAIVTGQEHIVYTIANKFYVLNYNSDTILRQITLQTSESIVSFKYIVDRLSTVAVTRTLYFYFLDDGSLKGSNTVTSDVVRIIDGSSSSVRVETTSGIQTVDVIINKKRLFVGEPQNRTKLMAKLDPVVVRGGIVVPVPTSKILLIENKNILYERLVFDEPMVALKLLNETTLVAVSDQARMALIDIRSGLKIKEIHLDTKINGAIDAVIQISDDTVLLKIKSKVIQVYLKSGQVDSISIN